MPNLNPSNMAAPVAPVYAQISIAPPGSTLAFIAGQVAVDVQGELVGKGDYRLQATQCFRNIAAALSTLGAEPHQMVRMTINVVDHQDELVEIIFAAGRDVFGENWPICASILLGVKALGHSDWLIEVDGIVHLFAVQDYASVARA